MNNDLKYQLWVDNLVQTTLPFDLQRKIAELQPLTYEESKKFMDVILLAGQARQIGEHAEILSRIDRNLAAQVEMLNVVHSIRNTQRRSVLNDSEPKRTSECDRWCYDKWEELRDRRDLIEAPISKAKVFEFLCNLRVQRQYLKQHGIILPRHFSSAVDNGRKCPPIRLKSPWK